MPILADASVQDIKRLLELFPIADLRQVWDLPGSKGELCQAVADQRNNEAIKNFVDGHISCCKQHVYVFTPPDGTAPALPDTIEGGERVHEAAGDHALYLVRSITTIVLKNPLLETTLEFLWPIRVQIADAHLIVRFVVLEKDLGAYFEGSYYVGDRGLDEKDIIASMVRGHDLAAADLHQGVKALWANGFMDSSRTKYKKPISLASEAMDEERGIREYNPELYAVLTESPLYNTLFVINPDRALTVSTFSVDPTRGTLAFFRYARAGDTDIVIREILRHNQ